MSGFGFSRFPLLCEDPALDLRPGDAAVRTDRAGWCCAISQHLLATAWKTRCRQQLSRLLVAAEIARRLLSAVSRILARCRTSAAPSAPATRPLFRTPPKNVVQDFRSERHVRGHRTERQGAGFAQRHARHSPSAKQLTSCWPRGNIFPDQASGFCSNERPACISYRSLPCTWIRRSEPALLNVLVAGFDVDHLVAPAEGGDRRQRIPFLSHGQRDRLDVESRAPPRAWPRGSLNRKSLERVSDGVIEYRPLINPLPDIDGSQIGELCILRSFEAASERLERPAAQYHPALAFR